MRVRLVDLDAARDREAWSTLHTTRSTTVCVSGTGLREVTGLSVAY
jgi:hypothetical protein